MINIRIYKYILRNDSYHLNNFNAAECDGILY